jgi:hypothetical protein
MQFHNFKIFVLKIIFEGRRLQRFDINGKELVRGRFSSIQIFSILFSIATLWLLPRGFSVDFAGYTIAFLGIFTGLFSSIVVSLYDQSSAMFEKYPEMEQLEKLRVKQVRNYLVQFTGLTAYAILIATALVILLSIVLLSERTTANLLNYRLVSNLGEINLNSLICFGKVAILIFHRVLTTYLLLSFFTITIFATSSYFAFLLSEYEKRKNL